jgi:hypothetical protein
MVKGKPSAKCAREWDDTVAVVKEDGVVPVVKEDDAVPVVNQDQALVDLFGDKTIGPLAS